MPKFELTYGSNTYVLSKEPAGWVDCKLNFIRSETFNSVLRSIATPIKFVESDKDYLLNIYDSDGFEAEVGFKAYLENDITLQYELFYEGVLDFSTIEIDRDYLSIEIIENNDIARFIANQEVEVNLDSEKNMIDETVTDSIETNYDLLISGVNLKNWVQFTADTGVKSFTVKDNNAHKLTNRKINSVEYSILTKSLDYDGVLLMKNDTGFDKYLEYDIDIKSIIDIEVNRQKGTADSTIFIRVGIYVVDVLGKVIRVDPLFYKALLTYDILPVTAPPTPIVYLNYYQNLSAKSKIFVEDGNLAYLGFEVMVNLVNSFNDNQIIIANCDYRILTNKVNLAWFSVNYLGNAYIDGYIAKDCVKRVLKRIVKNDLTFSMPVLSKKGGELFNVFFTNGNKLRGLNSSLKMNFKSLFETLNKLVPIGIFYDGIKNFYIDTIDNFYQNYQIFTLDEVTDFKININEKDVINQIEVGSGDNENNYELNSKAEINVNSQYSVSMSKIKNSLSLVTEYKYDSFGIFRKIIEGNQENETTNKSDDDTNYLINIDFNLINIGINYFNPAFPVSFDGAPFDDLFNYYFSPKRTILRNAYKFGFLDTIKNKKIKFNSSPCEIVYSIEMDDGLGVITEQTDIDISDISNKFLYLPEVYTFNFPIDANILKQLYQNPHGYIKFTHDSKTYYGYIESVEVNLNDFNAKWKLKKYYQR